MDILIDSIRLKYADNCYVVENEGLTKDNDIKYTKTAYFTKLDHAIMEVMERRVQKKNISTLQELLLEIREQRREIQEAIHVHGS